MKRIAFFVISLLMMLSFACATREYVRQQIEDCCNKAEVAAKKCEKAFELQQKK